MLAPLAAAAVILRAAQCRTGFDEGGLAVPGNLPGRLLPLVLLLAAGYIVLAARRLPAARKDHCELAAFLRFSGNKPAVLCVAAGVFLAVLGAAAALLADDSLLQLLLSLFAIVGALCVLYAMLALYHNTAVQGIALLVPVCALVTYAAYLYRTDATNPVLARVYIEILAISVLTYSALELASFTFRGGSPRACLCACAMGFVLSAAAAAELRSLSYTLLFGGCAFMEAGFLSAARLERKAIPQDK